MIRLNRVTRIYSKGGVRALDDVSLEISTGQFAAITGPSGCGKSTLLNLLGGLDTPDSGEIWIGDIPLHNAKDAELTHYRRHDLGIVFQFFNLLPAMTVAENVELPLLLRGERRRRLRVAAALELVDLAARKNHYPHQLSGGEMQRAAIAQGRGWPTQNPPGRRTYRQSRQRQRGTRHRDSAKDCFTKICHACYCDT